MHRLVIALTSLIVVTGVVVVAGYLFLFAGSPDRAARLVPADTLAYVNIYLQPSAGQRANLQGLITRFPGYGDPATVEDKIDETLQRFLAQAGVDYRSDLRPWLGRQVAIAVGPGPGDDREEPRMLLIAHAADVEQADAAIPRLAAARGEELRPEEHAGTAMWVGSESVFAIVGDMLLMGDTPAAVRAAIDVDRGAEPALADRADFVDGMRELPDDHLASIYIDLTAIAELGGAADEMAGYSSAAMAVLAEPEALRVIGHAPFDNGAAGAAARSAFALASEPSSLTDWMPPSTELSVVVFGVRQALQAAEEQLAGDDNFAEVRDALNQVRGIMAFGLGISLDADILPLFDREAAIAVEDLDADPPRAVLLLRPTDADAAEASLNRVRDALETRGLRVTNSQHEGVTVTTMSLPELGELSWALSEGVVLMALQPAAIADAVAARRSGNSLAGTDAYRQAFEPVEEHAGNEIFVNAREVIDRLAVEFGLPADTRAMLEPIRAVSVTLPAREDRIEFHALIPIDRGN